MRRQLKVFIVEVALACVGRAHGLQLPGGWKLPKMRYKGSSPQPQRLALQCEEPVCGASPAPLSEILTLPVVTGLTG